ncbi:CbrC family protein [Schlesneria paludicola]|uniref:CbrC family protein n=1 Tax=Schlesneria paludicola TaxID=360056 RepID=UPI000299E82F
MLRCSACGVENGLDADDRVDVACRSCKAIISFPESTADDIFICYSCLRAGKGALTQDTEFGMVSWDEAFEGVTHGVPGLKTLEFELVPSNSTDEWYGVRIPSKYLFELLRTPSFVTWQGEQWLFCCKQPMTYVGEWASLMKSPNRPHDPKSFLDQVLDEDERTKSSVQAAVLAGSGSVCVYVFQCKSCNRFRSSWDMD